MKLVIKCLDGFKMSDKNYKGKETTNDNQKVLKFRMDLPFRMFVGEINGSTVEKISPEELTGFKNGDKVVVMHSEDWLWFINELTDATKSSAIKYDFKF